MIAVLYLECLKMNSKLLCKLQKSSSALNSLSFSAVFFSRNTGMTQNLGEYTNWIFSYKIYINNTQSVQQVSNCHN